MSAAAVEALEAVVRRWSSREVTQKAFAESNGMPVTKVQAAFRLVRDELVVGG